VTVPFSLSRLTEIGLERFPAEALSTVIASGSNSICAS